MKTLKSTFVVITCLTLAFCAWVPNVRAAEWTFEWDATIETPESVGFTWTGSEPNPNEPSPTGLIIPPAGYYTLNSFPGEADTGWTVAFRVRRVDTSDLYGSFFAVFDNNSYVTFDFFANTHYRINTAGGLDYISAPGGTNQNFLDVQISKLGDTVNIYFSGDDTPVITFSAAAFVDPGNVFIGDFSSNDPTSEIGYLKWTDEGAFLPSQMIPEPSTYLLVLGGVAIGAWRLRKRASRLA